MIHFLKGFLSPKQQTLFAALEKGLLLQLPSKRPKGGDGPSAAAAFGPVFR